MAEQNFYCPHCNANLLIDDQYLGMELECPTCKQTFTAAKAQSIFPENSPVMPTYSNNNPVYQQRELENSIQQELRINAMRPKLAKFFKKAETAQKASGLAGLLAGVVEGLDAFLFIFNFIAKCFATPSKDIINMFKNIQDTDIPFLNQLDILPNYGKNSSQLVAEPYTLFSPAVDYETDENKPEFKFAVEKYDETFLYNLEEVIKIFTFEEQLFVFKAYWDYTTGKLFDESTEAFFFKDISDILTKNNYEYTYCKINSHIGFWEATKKHILLIAGFTFIFASFLGGLNAAAAGRSDTAFFAFVGAFILFAPLGFFISAAIAYNIEKNKTSKVLIKKSETFLITAKSGNSTGLTILCDEWVSAKNGTRYIRTDGEKIIHAIRKMIEEKKATANE